MLPPLVKPRLLITFLWDQLFSLPNPLPHPSARLGRCAAANKLKNTAPQADALTHTPNKQTNNTLNHTTEALICSRTREWRSFVLVCAPAVFTSSLSFNVDCFFFSAPFFASLLQRCQDTHTHTQTLMRGRGIIQRTVELPSEPCTF